MDSKWIEIGDLVRRAQDGDRDAFGELFERFRGSIFAVARKRGRNHEEAAELVQEVFLHAMRKIGQLREPHCFGAWLQRIAHRVAINRATRRPPMATTESEILEQEAGAGRTPLEDLMHSEQRAMVRSAVRSLRAIDRDALAAFYLKGKTLKEIAVEFEIPEGTVKRRLHDARQRLRDSLGSEIPIKKAIRETKRAAKTAREKELALC